MLLQKNENSFLKFKVGEKEGRKCDHFTNEKVDNSLMRIDIFVLKIRLEFKDL
jgi:hypothetical protein